MKNCNTTHLCIHPYITWHKLLTRNKGGRRQRWKWVVALTLLPGCTGAVGTARGGGAGKAEEGKPVRLCWELLAELLRLSCSALHSSSAPAEDLALTSSQGAFKQLSLCVSAPLRSSVGQGSCWGGRGTCLKEERLLCKHFLQSTLGTGCCINLHS